MQTGLALLADRMLVRDFMLRLRARRIGDSRITVRIADRLELLITDLAREEPARELAPRPPRPASPRPLPLFITMELRLDDKDARAWYSSGLTRTKLGDFELAVEELEHAAELAPGEKLIHASLERARRSLAESREKPPARSPPR